MALVWLQHERITRLLAQAEEEAAAEAAADSTSDNWCGEPKRPGPKGFGRVRAESAGAGAWQGCRLILVCRRAIDRASERHPDG